MKTAGHRALLCFGLVIATLGGAAYAAQSDFLEIFVPVRSVAVLALLVGGAIVVWRSIARTPRHTVMRTTGVAIGAAALLAGSAVYLREFRAYREIPITFESAGTTLAGSLYLPSAVGRYPAVVIAQGSIRAPRRVYHVWADMLVRHNIAVLSFDKRGTGSSGGEYEGQNNSSTKNLDLLAADVAAGVSALASQPEVDSDRVGIVGISMGGWTAPLAAQQNRHVKFVVCISGPAVSVGEQNYYASLTGEGAASSLAPHRSDVDAKVALRAPSGLNPIPTLEASRIPMLYIFGAEDTFVPVTKSLAVLERIQSAHEAQITTRVFPNADHLIVVERWPFQFASGFRDTLAEWIQAR